MNSVEKCITSNADVKKPRTTGVGENTNNNGKEASNKCSTVEGFKGKLKVPINDRNKCLINDYKREQGTEQNFILPKHHHTKRNFTTTFHTTK